MTMSAISTQCSIYGCRADFTLHNTYYSTTHSFSPTQNLQTRTSILSNGIHRHQVCEHVAQAIATMDPIVQEHVPFRLFRISIFSNVKSLIVLDTRIYEFFFCSFGCWQHSSSNSLTSLNKSENRKRKIVLNAK